MSAFPEVLAAALPRGSGLNLSEKVAALDFFADFIIKAQARRNSPQQTQCSAEATLVAALSVQFVTLLPTRAGIVQQAVGSCLSGQSVQMQSVQSTLRSSTVEELLTLADEHKDDSALRIAYLSRAALLSYNEKRYDLTIRILDGMTDEERIADLEFWEDLRSSAAAFLAFVRYQNGDHQGWRTVFENTPIDIRAFAQFGLVSLFTVNEIPTQAVRIEVLQSAAKFMARSEKPFSRKSAYWFGLVGQMSNLKQFSDASDVLKDIANAFNAAQKQTEEKGDRLEISRHHARSGLTAELLDVQNARLSEIIGSVNDPRSRVNINFVLLNVAVQKYQTLKRELGYLESEKLD
ncbi:MAG: hypothetical protein H0V76_09905 [Blastocatellia bacterium]|nr:hypothetical protein [Blastocatellia bacterium]